MPAGGLRRPDDVQLDLMSLTEEEFATRFSGSPIKRAKRRGLLRNVAVALGNWGGREAVPVLAGALDDPEPLIRGHAAWALGAIGGPDAVAALAAAIRSESDEAVLAEMVEAHSDCA